MRRAFSFSITAATTWSAIERARCGSGMGQKHRQNGEQSGSGNNVIGVKISLLVNTDVVPAISAF